MREQRKDDPRTWKFSKPKAKKDTKRWCKGREGREHKPNVRISGWAVSLSVRFPDRTACGYRTWFPERWSCHHERYCTACGKVLDYTLGDSCPDKPKDAA